MSYNDYSLADIAAATGGNRNGGGWGGDWSSWIILFLIFGMFGWGGFGGFGGFGGGMNGGIGSEVQRGFDHSSVITKLDGLAHGQCDSTYALNGTMTNGFANAELGAANRQAALMQQLFGMQSAADKCCCETQRLMERGFCDTQNIMERNTRDIIDNQNGNARAILDALTAQRIEAKDETIARQNQQIFQLQLAASQSDQNGFFNAAINSAVAQLRRPTPVPAYNVPNPYTGQYGYGRNPCRDSCYDYAA